MFGIALSVQLTHAEPCLLSVPVLSLGQYVVAQAGRG